MRGPKRERAGDAAPPAARRRRPAKRVSAEHCLLPARENPAHEYMQFCIRSKSKMCCLVHFVVAGSSPLAGACSLTLSSSLARLVPTCGYACWRSSPSPVYITGFLGIALIIVGVFSDKIVNKIVNDKVQQELVLTPGTKGTSTWMDPTNSLPINYGLYLYNVTNPDEVENGGTPNVEQVGPFMYREDRKKFNVSWVENESEIQFEHETKYIFDEELSATGEDTVITALNLPLLGIGQMLKQQGIIERIGLTIVMNAMRSERLFVRKTARELLWGYKDPLFQLVHLLKKEIPEIQSLQKNGSVDDATRYSRIVTGKNDMGSYMFYREWDGVNNLTFWGDQYANMINGTDGTQFPPELARDASQVPVFVDVLYRSVTLDHVGDVEVEDIKLREFRLTPELLDSAEKNPANEAFFSYGPSGVLNITSAVGAPIFISKPHFLDGDPVYREKVTGLDPDRAAHDTFLDIEPITGVVMNAHKRLQINFHAEPVPFVMSATKITPAVVPVFWADEGARITPQLASQFRSEVYKPLHLAHIGRICVLCLGSLLVVLAVGLYARKRRRAGQKGPAADLIKDTNGRGEMQYLLDSSDEFPPAK